MNGGKLAEMNSGCTKSSSVDDDNVPLLSTKGSPNLVSVISWNIAAINNNPFEYWMDPSGSKDSHVAQAEAAYNRLMTEADSFIAKQREAAADQQIKVKDIMTAVMVDELFQLMGRKGWVGLEEARHYYEKGTFVCSLLIALLLALFPRRPLRADVAERGIIAGILFDPKIGKKRLCSWCTHTLLNSLSYPSSQLLFTLPRVHSFTQSSTHLLTRSVILLRCHSFIHSLTLHLRFHSLTLLTTPILVRSDRYCNSIRCVDDFDEPMTLYRPSVVMYVCMHVCMYLYEYDLYRP